MRNDFKYLGHFSVQKWYMIQIYKHKHSKSQQTGKGSGKFGIANKKLSNMNAMF